MNPKYIAAFEIGSSRIKGVVASVDSDEQLKILAVEEADSGDAVRYGRVQNAREVSERVNELVRKLENNPKVVPGRISTVFIADGGRSLLSFPSEASLKFNNEEEITRRIFDRLHKDARDNLATDRDILAVAPKRLFVDSAEVKKIIGTNGSSVRGEFTVITQSPANRRALERVHIESHAEDVARDYVTRLLAQTEMALNDSDRQIGCLFIDFGAETTSVAAFRDGALLFAVTLPIGGANITRDLSAALNVTSEKAKSIKHQKGFAVVDRNKYESPDVETREIVNIVSARAGEIIENINNIIELQGYKTSDFPGGIIIAGGASNLKGFDEMAKTLLKADIRRATIAPNISSAVPEINAPAHFDIIALASYAARHSDIDCLSFDETPAQPILDEPKTKTSLQTVDEPEIEHRAGRRNIAEDDPRLLEDDIEQPVVINEDDDDDLPEKGPDAEHTRISLLERLKRIKKIMLPPIDMIEGDDMDN